MNPDVKVAAFFVALCATFGVAAAIGAAVGPIDVSDSDAPAPVHEGH